MGNAFVCFTNGKRRPRITRKPPGNTQQYNLKEKQKKPRAARHSLPHQPSYTLFIYKALSKHTLRSGKIVYSQFAGENTVAFFV